MLLQIRLMTILIAYVRPISNISVMYENMKAVSLKYGFCRKSLRKGETLTSWTPFWAYLSSLLGGFAVAHKIHTDILTNCVKFFRNAKFLPHAAFLREWPWMRFLKKISIYQLPGRMSWPSRKKNMPLFCDRIFS